MLSSTYKELVEQRQAVREAMLTQQLFPVAMEDDAALPDYDLFSSSLGKVDLADGYVGLIGYRYGQASHDAVRNPDKLSLTELEFRRAVARGIPICMFIMGDDHPVPRRAVGGEGEAEYKKLQAFIELAKKDRIYAEFDATNLKAKAIQSLLHLRNAIQKRAPSVLVEPHAVKPALQKTDLPPGWAILDREALAAIRASPPTRQAMIQFFDGVVPQWDRALAAQPRAIVERLADMFRSEHTDAQKPRVVLLTAAGGEGKSTVIRQVAGALVGEALQEWTCLYRHATNAQLPTDALAKLEHKSGHAWIVVVDDADNVAGSILNAVKEVGARTDVHLLLAAREADWRLKRLAPDVWRTFCDFRPELLRGVTEDDARVIVKGWMAFGSDAMGHLKGCSEDEAVAALLGNARDLAANKEEGELLGALLLVRQGKELHQHVRGLIDGLGREPVIGKHSLRDIYAMIAAMHDQNQLYLSRSVLEFALGCKDNPDQLEDVALGPLRQEAAVDGGATYIQTRHRRIAEAACAVLRDDGYNVDRLYGFLAGMARRQFVQRQHVPDIADWSLNLAEHFVGKGNRWWGVATDVARSVYLAEPNDPHRVTAYSKVLRLTNQSTKAMNLLRETGEVFRDHPGVLHEWSTVAIATNEPSIAAWLTGKTLADGSFDAQQCGPSLGGLGIAFHHLFEKSKKKAFAAGRVACGYLGQHIPDPKPTDREYFDRYLADGPRYGVEGMSDEGAVAAIRKAVIEGALDVEPGDDPLFFERLLGDPEGYRYSKLLRTVGTAKTTPVADPNP